MRQVKCNTSPTIFTLMGFWSFFLKIILSPIFPCFFSLLIFYSASSVKTTYTILMHWKYKTWLQKNRHKTLLENILCELVAKQRFLSRGKQ